jgi:hypothetical protein
VKILVWRVRIRRQNTEPTDILFRQISDAWLGADQFNLFADTFWCVNLVA